MPQNTDTQERGRDIHPEQTVPPTIEQVREALARLREMGEKLPPVDAVAIVREGRDLSGQESR